MDQAAAGKWSKEPPAGTGEEIIACHECGLVHRLPALSGDARARCRACRATIYRHVESSVERSLALLLAALFLFIVANAFPIMSMSLEGQTAATTILDGVAALYAYGMWPVALVVLATGFLMPLAKILGMLTILVPLWLGSHPRWLVPAFRWVERLHPWSMMEVYLLGVIVAVVKLRDLATIELGVALYAFAGTILLTAAADALFVPHEIWRRLAPQADPDVLRPRAGTILVACEQCDQLVRCDADAAHGAPCPRCGVGLHRRKPDSVTRTWALIVTATILYIPANLYPIMTVTSFGQGEPDTILSGVRVLLEEGMWPVALLVFFASVTVPVLKLAGLSYLLISVQRRQRRRARDRTLLYRVIEGVGRWSMVDVFMIAILSALVALGNVASVQPGPGAIAFCLVVIVTMIASLSFDPRLIWDVLDERSDHDRALRA